MITCLRICHLVPLITSAWLLLHALACPHFPTALPPILSLLPQPPPSVLPFPPLVFWPNIIPLIPPTTCPYVSHHLFRPSSTTRPIPASFRAMPKLLLAVQQVPQPVNVSLEPPGRMNHQGNRLAWLGFDTRSTDDSQTEACLFTHIGNMHLTP